MKQYGLGGKFIPEDDLPQKCPWCRKGCSTTQALGSHKRTCPRRPLAAAPAPAPAMPFPWLRPAPAPAPVETLPAEETGSTLEAERICRADGFFPVAVAAPDSGEARLRASQRARGSQDAMDALGDTPGRAPPRGRRRERVANTPSDRRRSNGGAPLRRRRGNGGD